MKFLDLTTQNGLGKTEVLRIFTTPWGLVLSWLPYSFSYVRTEPLTYLLVS